MGLIACLSQQVANERSAETGQDKAVRQGWHGGSMCVCAYSSSSHASISLPRHEWKEANHRRRAANTQFI